MVIEKLELFRFNNVMTEYDVNHDYTEFHKSDYPVKSIEYKSNYIAWDERVYVFTKVEPNEKVIELKEPNLEETEETEPEEPIELSEEETE